MEENAQILKTSGILKLLRSFIENIRPPPRRPNNLKNNSSFARQNKEYVSNNGSILNERSRQIQDQSKREDSFALNESLLNATPESIMDLDDSIFPLLENSNFAKNLEGSPARRNYSTVGKLELERNNFGLVKEGNTRHTMQTTSYPQNFKNDDEPLTSHRFKNSMSDNKNSKNLIQANPTRQQEPNLNNSQLYQKEIHESPLSLDWKSEIIQNSSIISDNPNQFRSLNLDNLLGNLNLDKLPRDEEINKLREFQNFKTPIKIENTKNTNAYKSTETGSQEKDNIESFKDNSKETPSEEQKKRVSFVGTEEVIEGRSTGTRSSPSKSSIKPTGKFNEESLRKKLMELPVESDNDDEEDDRGGFCGFCFGKRKKKTKASEKAI